MRPNKNDSSVEIPLTIDVPMQYKELNKKRLSIGFLTIIATWIGCIAFVIAFGSDNMGVYIFGAVVGVGVTMFIRLLYFNEKYYKKHYDDMLEHNYKYDCTQVWEIYEIAPKFPICHFKNGSKALFVMFDKDVIVGKDIDTEFYHYEAIANAYQMLSSKGIEFMHIDYMDTVGKDSRFDPVVENLLKTKNSDLQQLLSVIFEYQTFCMSRAYSTYDVYAFYYKYDDAMFKDDIELIISQFLNANYKRYRILGVDDMRELMKSIYNIDEFSVLRACDSVFRNENSSELVRVIWTERDGIRTVLNKTTEEKEEQKQQNKKQNPTHKGAVVQPSWGTPNTGVAAPVAPTVQAAKPTYVSNFASENDAYIYADDDEMPMNASSDFSSQSVGMYDDSDDYTAESNYNQQQYTQEQQSYSTAAQNADFSTSDFSSQQYDDSQYTATQQNYQQYSTQQSTQQFEYTQQYNYVQQSGYTQQSEQQPVYNQQYNYQQVEQQPVYTQQQSYVQQNNYNQYDTSAQQGDENLYAKLEEEDNFVDDSSYNADALTFNPNNVKRNDDDYNTGGFNASDFNASTETSQNYGSQESGEAGGISANDFDSDEELIDLFGE